MVMIVVMMLVRMAVVVVVCEVNIKFHAGDGRFLLAGNVEVIAVELELFQLAFKFGIRPRQGRAARR